MLARQTVVINSTRTLTNHPITNREAIILVGCWLARNHVPLVLRGSLLLSIYRAVARIVVRDELTDETTFADASLNQVVPAAFGSRELQRLGRCMFPNMFYVTSSLCVVEIPRHDNYLAGNFQVRGGNIDKIWLEIGSQIIDDFVQHKDDKTLWTLRSFALPHTPLFVGALHFDDVRVMARRFSNSHTPFIRVSADVYRTTPEFCSLYRRVTQRLHDGRRVVTQYGVLGIYGMTGIDIPE